ncbi:hypothetical protein FRB99_003637, partial [Tulasnella sp. 403]
HPAAKQITFSGSSGKECEDFILNIRQYAFSKGKLKDKEWMALFASTCFSGRALGWHIMLDNDAKGNWDLLEVALLKEWPFGNLASEGLARPLSTSIVPASASIVTPPVPPPTNIKKPEEHNPLYNGDRKRSSHLGKIRVDFAGGGPGYINTSKDYFDPFANITFQREAGTIFKRTGKRLQFSYDNHTFVLCLGWYYESVNGVIKRTTRGYVTIAEEPKEDADIWEMGPTNAIVPVVGTHTLLMGCPTPNFMSYYTPWGRDARVKVYYDSATRPQIGNYEVQPGVTFTFEDV